MMPMMQNGGGSNNWKEDHSLEEVKVWRMLMAI
jgi:hypothetical protein